MRKILKRIFAVTLLVASLFTIAACSGGLEVKFDTNGGQPEVEAIKVKKNETIDAMDDVVITKEGYEFLYWYLDSESLEFDFTTPITESITLTAKWIKLHTVKFELNNSEAEPMKDIVVKDGEKLPKITNPKDVGIFSFVGWYVDSEDELFDLNTAITKDVVLKALWDNIEEKALEDYNAIIDEGIMLSSNQLNLPTRGALNKTRITWSTDSKYVSKSGFILPLLKAEEQHQIVVKGVFSLGSVEFEKEFTVDLKYAPEVVINEKREIKFKNITTEYDVEDGTLDLYFEDGGEVPYVDIVEFFELIKGFIDPDIEFEVTQTETMLEIAYDHYDEDEDHTYHLVNTIDLVNNTISTNDPGFYWAYVYSTETNYGRHIEYLYNHEGNYRKEGVDVVYELSNYNLSLTSYEGKILAPYYLVNQLYAGSSYYNVYYNYDTLYGIYSLPEAGSDEYKAIKKSSMNSENLPEDLLIHTINSLAFNMDYFYGLKDILEIETFYDYIFERKDSLFTVNARNFDNSLHDILVKDLDEPHTSYGYPSYYNTAIWSGPSITMINQFGPRMQEWYGYGLYAMDDVIEEKWGREGISSNQWAANSESRPYYWLLDETHAVVTFDRFVTSDIEEDNVYNDEYVKKVMDIEQSNIIPNLDGGTKYFYYNNSSQEYNKLELIVKGLELADVDSYKSSLEAAGYAHVTGDSKIEHKESGYYSIVVDEKEYFVLVTYDERFGLMYVGLSDEGLPEEFDDTWSVTGDIISLVEADSAVYLEIVLEELFKEEPEVDSITLDISWNMGGNVGALYRVVGFITDQSFKTSRMDGASKGASTTHIKVDGVPSYSHIKWSLLTSKVSFSAANSLATIFLENKLGPIIGQTSGGGASSITPILLPNGTAYTMSSNSIGAYRVGLGTEEDPYRYLDNEYGIEPHYILETENMLNEEKILEALNEYYK